MRNFFILCAATALASAVSLSQVNDNDNTGLDVVGEVYVDIEYDMYEQSDDEHDDEIVAKEIEAAALSNTTNATAPVHIPELLNTAIRGKLILFQGDYREKEIDKFFAINPVSKIGERIHYNSRPLIPNDVTTDSNDPEYKRLTDVQVEGLFLENVLVGA